MSGHQPYDGQDADDVFPDETDQLDAEASGRLSEVTAFLASVPAPALPDNLEARISAAIAAEASRRAQGGAWTVPGAQAPDGTRVEVGTQVEGVTPAGDGLPVEGGPQPEQTALADAVTRPGPATARPRGRRPGRSRRRGRSDSSGPPRRDRSRLYLRVTGSVAVVLLFVGLGFAFSLGHSSDSSSSGPAGSAAGSAAGAAAGPASSASSTSAAASGAEPAAGSAAGQAFAVTDSGTRYRQATLGAQVRAQLAGGVSNAPGTARTPDSASSAASSSAAGRSEPSSTLAGCVLHFTGGAAPKLVDRATYQGTAAYVIASSSRVWVVRPGCTAAKPELIATVPLAG